MQLKEFSQLPEPRRLPSSRMIENTEGDDSLIIEDIFDHSHYST